MDMNKCSCQVIIIIIIIIMVVKGQVRSLFLNLLKPNDIYIYVVPQR